MTEMEQLKKNADEQKIKEQFTAIFTWMDEVDAEWSKELVRYEKNLNLTALNIVVQLILGFVFQSPLWIVCFFIWVILLLKQNNISEKCNYHKGRLLGAHKILFFLGISNTDLEEEMKKRRKRRKVLRKSPFKRFKEFFERMGAKNKTEAHA